MEFEESDRGVLKEAPLKKETVYCDDFMTEEEEKELEYKKPFPKLKNKETFMQKKEEFNLNEVLTKFVLSKEQFIFAREGNVYQYYEFTDEKLGEGGFSEVFKVIEKETGHVRAAKKILRSKIKNYQRFINEVWALKTCDHPNIVKFYEIFEETDAVFLIQEYLSGGELFDYIVDNDHLTEKEASNIFSQIIKALVYCHKKNLTHRDLKPENFMFKSCEKGSPLKLIDFGYAKKFQKDPTDTAGMFVRMRSRVGTENYLAPEILQRNYSHS